MANPTNVLKTLRKNTLTLLGLGILLSFCGCKTDSQSKKPVLFKKVPSEKSGVSFRNTLTDSPNFNIIEYLYFYNGGGVATGDINNDGLIDLYFTANQAPNRLYLNKGNFEFEDITQKSGITESGTWSTGAVMADVNGDGFLDIYLCQVGDYKEAKGSNQLFINNQDGTFSEQSKAYGLDFVGFSTHAAFFDYDRDGDLDMYLLNHSIKNPEVFVPVNERSKSSPGGDKLYQNQLAQGKKGFVDVTEQAGIYSSVLGFGLGLAISDINKDGWPDIYVSNDFTENDYLYINQQNGTFKEQLEKHIQHTSRYSMGNFVADINNDAQVDIFTTDMLPEDPEIWKKSIGEDKVEVYRIKEQFGYGDQYVRNTLQLNLGNGMFSDISLFAENFATDWSWAPLIFDMNNDGLQDIHITNGIYKRPNDLDFVNYLNSNPGAMDEDQMERARINSLPTLKIPNYAALNAGNGRFNTQPFEFDLGFDEPTYSNGSAYADLDNDGDLDLIINNIEQEALLYQNTLTENNSYLKIRFEGSEHNAFGIGAQVYIRLPETTLFRENFNSRGFQSSVAPELHFGLGKNTMPVSVEVIWPDGKRQQLDHVSLNQTLTLYYSEAKTASESNTRDEKALFSTHGSLFDYRHREDEFNDQLREYLMPRKFSTEGPALAIADVDGDGLEDIYLGGAKDQPAELWLQQPNGQFKRKLAAIFERLQRAEDINARFFDADNDGDQDLYVVSGGNEYEDGQVFNFDRLYLNDGRGNFQFSPGALNRIGSQGKALAIADFDGDGDQDVFVGANVVPGAYGKDPQHFLLINNGRAYFEDQTNQRLQAPTELGMINAAEPIDFDGDGDIDLVLAGEWTGITLLQNNGSGQFEKASIPDFVNTQGWWFSLHVTDVNNDGLPDIVAGNLGLNTKLKASEERPVTLSVNDIDGNGQIDPIIFHYQNGKQTPFASRDDLIKQVSKIKKLHSNYEDYAKNSSPETLLGEYFTQGYVKTAKTFESVVFLNKGNSRFQRISLPATAQLSPVMSIVSGDYNEDGHTDLLLFGNNYSFRTDLGKANARPITLLLGQGNGHFEHTHDSYLNNASTWGEFRTAGVVVVNGKETVLALRNNDYSVWLQPGFD
ncbi:VCBS repeat-containing protein [Roseivirga sp. UBA1976]|uniref:VCBS repeat-containing protein n=1 Tax=Roseivirga sp. UBA1976 TaxID=1947386 RepID=UPI0025796F24|nr:VCBS repeat-containing protein [Roseivirga sp. UBA1976]MEC7752810.1 VCBS repeat-containing protein [Bacteroidota bacterium]|tara:strand:+ start:1593 stop:4934 length:3342 start_codon:yes stop_codon:yes gene_type:complete